MGITPPVDYMKRDSIFSQIAIENSYEFGKITRRPHICGGFISSHQLLGPYVILTFNETNRQVNSKILPGAGSVEQILAKIMDQSIFMELNYENPDLLSFYVPLKINLEENEIDILQ